MDDLIQALVGIGFSKDEAEKQINELNNAILAQVAVRLLGDDFDVNMSQDETKLKIEQSKAPEQVLEVFKEVSGNLVKGYFDAVSESLDEDKKQTFREQIYSISQSLSMS